MNAFEIMCSMVVTIMVLAVVVLPHLPKRKPKDPNVTHLGFSERFPQAKAWFNPPIAKKCSEDVSETN